MDNVTGQRKRVGRSVSKLAVPPEPQQQSESNVATTEEELDAGAASQLTDIDGSNVSTVSSRDTFGATAAAGAECRRSSRKKIIKFDVRDLLNKNRKPHKIQIEARIDSNAPTPIAASPRQTAVSAAGGSSANSASSSTAASDLTSKQKTFIEKSAIFRRYSISAEQQSKIPAPLRPPLPPVAKLTPNKISLLSNTSAADVSIANTKAETAKIAQARRLSRTQEIFNASMLKSKQNSSLIVAQMESSSSNSSSTINMQRKTALSVSDNADTKNRATAIKSTTPSIAIVAKQPYAVPSVTSKKSSSPAVESKAQKKRGRPPKNKPTDIQTSGATSANKESPEKPKLTPEKAKNWQEYKACFKVCDYQPKLIAPTRLQTADEILEISSSSESESDSIQSPGSDESYTLNEPSTSKRQSKQRNFAAVSFLQEITSKLSDNVAAPEFYVASVEEIHSEPLTPYSSLTNLHDSQLLVTAESSNKIDAGDAEKVGDEAAVIQQAPTCDKVKIPSRLSSIRSSNSESDSNSDRSQSKSYRNGNKLRVSVKRLSAQELSPGKENTSAASPPSPENSLSSSSSSPTNSSNESSSIKEDSSDLSRERKQHTRKRSKRLQMQELEKSQITDGGSSLEEKETTKNKKRKTKSFNSEKVTVDGTMEDETNNSDIAKAYFEKSKSLDMQKIEPQKADVIDAKMEHISEPQKAVVNDSKIENKEVTIVNESQQTKNKVLDEKKDGNEKEEKIQKNEPLKKSEIEDINKIDAKESNKNETELIEKANAVKNKKELNKNKNIETKTIGSKRAHIKDIEEKNNKQNEKPLSTTKEEKPDKGDVVNEANRRDDEEKRRKYVDEIEKSKDVEEEKKDNDVEELNAKDADAAKIKKDQVTQQSEDIIIKTIEEKKELKNYSIEIKSKDDEKLNREIENEIAKEIKDLINKDIDKECQEKTVVDEFKCNEIEQLNVHKTIAVEELGTIKEEELNNKKVREKTKNRKVLKRDKPNDTKKASGDEEICKNENLRQTRSTPTPPGKKSKDNKDSEETRITPTPPENQSKDKITVIEPENIVTAADKSDITSTYPSSHSMKSIQCTPPLTGKKSKENKGALSSAEPNDIVPSIDKSNLTSISPSTSAKDIEIVAKSVCETKVPQKLQNETAADNQFASAPLLSNVEIHSKSMPKTKEAIKLPPKKQLREHKINIELDRDTVTSTEAISTPNLSNIVSQITEQVNVETKTLLDILKTVQSNETAAAAATVSKTANEEKVKSGDSPPISPKSPRSPAAVCKKPTTTLRRYERRSRRGGEDETLHKTLEETFAEIAAQSSKAILEMFSSREKVEGSQEETSVITGENTKEETKGENKEETKEKTTEESKEETKEESKEETKQESKEETKEETTKEETKKETKEESKVETKEKTEKVTKEESRKIIGEETELIESKHSESSSVVELVGFCEESNSPTLSEIKASTIVLGEKVSVDIVGKKTDETMKITDSATSFEEASKTTIVDKPTESPSITKQRIGKTVKETEEKTKSEEKTKPVDKTKLEDKTKQKEKTEREEKTKLEGEAISEEESKTEEKTKIDSNTKPEEKTKSEKKTKSNEKIKFDEKTKFNVKTHEEQTKSGEKIKPEDNTNSLEKTKPEDVTQIEVKTTTPAKRGRKLKAKEKESTIQSNCNRSVRSRKATVTEKSFKPQEILKKTNESTEKSETCSKIEGSTEDSEKTKNISETGKELPNTELTETKQMVLATIVTKEIENIAENKNSHLLQEPPQKSESLETVIKITKEQESNEKSEKILGVKTTKNVVELPYAETSFEQREESESQKRSLTEAAKYTLKEDKESTLTEENSKILEKTQSTKTEDNVALKKSQFDNKKQEKPKEKNISVELLNTSSSSSSSEDLVSKSMNSVGEVLPKPPPKKRIPKGGHQQQCEDSKESISPTQDKIEENPKKVRKSAAKLNTSLTKEELVAVTSSETASMSTSLKRAPKTKQKRTMTPTEILPVPSQPSCKKKSKKQDEERSSLPSVASSPKTPENKAKKTDRKKFLEPENDADGKTAAVDDKTAKKKRQRKLKEAFEAALTEIGSTTKETASIPKETATTLKAPTTAIVITTTRSETTTIPIVTTPTKTAITPTKTATPPPTKTAITPTKTATPPPIPMNASPTLTTTSLPNLDKLADAEPTVDPKPTSPTNVEAATSPDRQTPQSPMYNMPLTPTNFDLKTTPLPAESISTEPALIPKEVVMVVQPEEDPDDPLKDIEKFIEDGVNLLKRGYKMEDDEDDSVDGVLNAAKKLVKEDLLLSSTPLKDRDLTHHIDLATLTSFAETPTDTPLATPSVTPPPKSPTGPETPPPLSDDSFTTSGGVRRSHRIKLYSKTPKALVGRGLVRDKERVSLKDDVETKTHYTIDDHRMDLAEVEAKNAKFLKDMEERLSNFRVIKENEYKCERIVSKEAKKMICDCFLTADEEERGELACGEDCLNRLLMIECGPDCNVKGRCTNKRFQKFLSSPCRVFRTEKKGFGILADIEILPGEFIMEYVGEVINGDEFERRRVVYSLDKNRHYYFMALRSDAIIDATSKGNISRFINHSCDPNAETQKWTVNGELRIGFFSRKSIMPGEEITFDYQYQRYGREAQRCYCESSNCRGWIGEEPNSDEGEQVDDDSDGDEEEENLAESLLAEDDDDEDDSDETDADADAEEAQKKLEKAAAEAKLTPILEEEDKKQILDTTLASTEKRKKSDSEADGVLETSKEEDSKSKFKKLLSKMAEKVAKKKNKKERRRKQRTARDAAGTAIKPIKPRFLEDPDIEDEVQFLSRCGLKNQSDTLRLSRLMVRAKLVQTRLNLLKILRSGELPCRRLFLDYHGLRLLHGWISEDGGDLNTRLALLETLESLPIANKTMLTDSKVYQAVRNWCGNGISMGDLTRSNSLSPSDESSKESTNSQVAQPQEIPAELKKLALKLTATWDSLPEIFRIPKRERIEQMKEHEREADRQYAAVAATRDEEDTRRNYSTSDRYQRDRFGRGGPPGGGSNSSHRFSWSRGGGGNGKETRNISVLGTTSSSDPRRRGCGMDATTHGSSESTKHLSKEQRREMFAAKVARDEAEKRLAEERREFETKCRFFGLDPKKTRPQNLPFCVNPSTGQWYSADRQPIPTPPSYAHVQVPVKPKSTNPADYQLPPTTANLSHKWKFAITPQGKIYYYHVQFRIPQWEPPTHEQMYGSSAMQAAGATTNSDSGSDGVANESTDDDDEIIKGMEPTRLQAYVDQKIEMRRQQRYNRLVDERSISPRREEDRIYNQSEVRKYKENKEKIRKRKEEIRRRRVEAVQNSTLNMCTLGKLDDVLTNTGESIKSSKLDENESVLPIQDYLLSSDEEEAIKAECNNSPLIDKIVQGDKIVDELDALTSKRPLKRQLPTHRDFCSSSSGFSGSSSSSSPATYSSSVEKHEQHKKRKLEKRESSKSGKKSKDQDSKYRKLKEKFRCEIAGIIVHHLKPYRKEACIIGRIQSNDDFNHLARKLTHFVMIKELKYCESIGQTLVVTESVKNKSREFIKKYMAKYGDVYIKPDNDPDFKDIPFTLKI